jgi:hypothetical protein
MTSCKITITRNIMFSELLRVLKLDPGILRYIKSRSNPNRDTTMAKEARFRD